MSELIDRSVLKARMYTEAFESDTNMQRWDSGCWIRYKLFEKVVNNMPTVPYSPRWHRVEEPPKEYGNYLAVVNGEVMEVTYSDMRDDWKWSTCDAEGFVWIRSELVTHWMPLPDPPKEDA